MPDHISALATRLALGALIGGWLCGAAVESASAATVQLGAAKDTMIFQNNPDNGAGGAPGFFAGTNSQPSPRRGLVEFDLSTIPSNATITDVQLRLVIGQIAGSGGGGGGGGFSNPVVGLYKLLADWGEANTGASTAAGLGGIGQGSPAVLGDATWNERFSDANNATLSSPWSQPGGQPGVDYVGAASASLAQGNAVNDVSLWLSTPSLVADVQGWLASPGANFGWMLINTNESAAQTFRGFFSRNYNPNPTVPNLESFFPKLIVTYAVPEPSGIILFAMAMGAIIPLRRAAGRQR
jgi:hypothetical protein